MLEEMDDAESFEDINKDLIQVKNVILKGAFKFNPADHPEAEVIDMR